MKQLTVYVNEEKKKKINAYRIEKSMSNGNIPSMNEVINDALDLLLAGKDTSPSVPDSKPDTEQTIEPVTEGKYAHLLDNI